jgi:hypothetical protein
MFGFSKEILLKKELLYFLDKQEEGVSSKDISDYIQSLTSQTVRKYLKEIAESISELYSPEQMQLNIGTRYGSYLLRKGTNFDCYFEELYTKNIVYHIYQQLILHRSFLTSDFCQRHAVSMSTLRRIIKKINDALTDYQIHLKIGTKVTVVGNEKQIRVFFFMFLYTVHRKLSSIQWIDSEKYLKLGQQICEAFYIFTDNEYMEILGIWLFINQQSDQLGKPIESNVFENFTSIVLPDSELTLDTWEFILIVMYVLDLVDFEPELNFEKIHQNSFSDSARKWLLFYENRVRQMMPKEKENLYLQMYKLSILDQIVPTSEKVKAVFSIFDEAKVQEIYPYFWIEFEKMWEAFVSQYTLLDTKKYKQVFLEWTLQYASKEKLFPIIQMYLKSSLPKTEIQLMKKTIEHKMLNTAQIVFVSEEKIADITLSTETTQKDMLINANLTEKDFSVIKEGIMKLLQ